MKVTGGALRGRAIRTARGQAMRPTAAKVREALFNIIGPEVQDCRFLDLCAGSGSVGIGALSRGAATGVFVDNHSTSIRLIHRNLGDLGLESRAVVLRRDALRALSELERRGMVFDEVFFDPPYGSDLVSRCLRSTRWRAIIRGRGRIFIEHRRDIDVAPPAGWQTVGSRNFGETVLTALRGESDQ